MSNKNSIKLRWILLILWMAFIFFMSHQPGDVSSEQSKIVVAIFSFLGINLDSIFGELATLVVRKGAHFSEYFILYILMYRVFSIYYNKQKALIIGIIGVFLYASTDELHQYFVEGRVAAFTDILIDTFGGIVSSIVLMIINKMKERGSKIYSIE